MTNDQHLTSFGLFLQAARIEKQMSIEDLAAETRIRDEVLKRLEAEEHARLPDEVFVKGFIRSYATAVGADVEEALKRYGASRVRRDEKFERQTTIAAQPRRFWLRLGAALGAVLLMVGLTLYFYSRLNTPSEPPVATSSVAVDRSEPPSAADASVTETVASPTEAMPPAAAPPKIAPQVQPNAYRLEIKALEETWLKIIIDDQNAQELTLAAGDVKQIEATTLFNLLIGNAGGVELKLNDTPVAISGKSGQVVNLQLP